MAYPAPLIDLQVQQDGTLRDAVSGTNATISRNGVKHAFDTVRELVVEAPANRLASVRYPNGSGWWGEPEIARTNFLLNNRFAGSHGARGIPTSFVDVLGSSSLVTASVQRLPMNMGEALRIRAENISGEQVFPNLVQNIPGLSEGQAFTASVYYRNASRSSTQPVRLQIIARSSGMQALGTVTANLIDGTSDWRRAVISYPSLPANTTSVDVRVFHTTLDPGRWAEADIFLPQLEGGIGATSPILTTTASVHRLADSITFPVPVGLNVDAGTVVAVRGDTATPTANNWLFAWRASNFWQTYLGIYAQHGSFGNHAATWRGDDQTFRASTLAKATAGPVVTTGRWANRSMTVFADATAGSPTAQGSAITQSILENVVYFGCYATSGQFNGPIHRMMVFGSALTDAQIAAVAGATIVGVGAPRRRRAAIGSLGGIVKG